MTKEIGVLTIASEVGTVWDELCIDEDGHRIVFETLCYDHDGEIGRSPHVLDAHQLVSDWHQYQRKELVYVPSSKGVLNWYYQSTVAAALAEDPS